MKVNINAKAPIIAKQKIKINAPAVKVWSILTEIDKWPDWQAAVKKAHLKSSLKEGAEFSWAAGGVILKSIVHTCEQFHAFGWTGKTIGTSAIHNWRIESINDGTMVFVEESQQGFLPLVFKKKFQRNLEQGMSKNLQELKDESEK